MPKTEFPQTNWTLGELSPRAFGRFELDRPIFKNGAKMIENFLIAQLGGVFFSPGTRYVAEVKDSTAIVKFQRFEYSTTQTYVLELGNLYMRFFANSAQLISGGLPVEVVTPFLTAELFAIRVAQKLDVMYMVHASHAPQKLTRLTSTSFNLAQAAIIRGPFLDSNITATTITPSADAGAGVVLTASSALFQAGHIGSLWRVKSGVVKITAFTSTTQVTGDVQTEPSGAAGALATGPGAVTDWAEGAFSAVQGYPSAVTFHEGRLYYGKGQTFFGSVIGAYDNFAAGSAGASDAVKFEIASDAASAIRWLFSGNNVNGSALILGTQGGTYSANGSAGSVLNPSNVQVSFDTDVGVAPIAPHAISGYLHYLTASLFQMRELVSNFQTNRNQASDMTLLADHILRDGSGAVDMERQQSPNDRIWVVRADGQLAVLTRNPEQQVMGWSRRIGGTDSVGNGLFETICIIPRDGQDDQIWVVVKRTIGGVTKRFVEYFTSEDFTDPWDPVRVDCSLTLDSPVVISGITAANPAVVTATAHGFVNGNQVKIDNVLGMTQVNGNHYLIANVTANTFELRTLDSALVDSSAYTAYKSAGEVRKMVTAISGLNHLEGQVVTVQTDGAIPSDSPTYTVSGGAITLTRKAAVVHAGLPYTGTLQMLKLGDGGAIVSQTQTRRIYKVIARLFRSLGISIGLSLDKLTPGIVSTPNDPLGHSPDLVTGDLDLTFDTGWDTGPELIIRQTQPLPLHILALVCYSDVENK